MAMNFIAAGLSNGTIQLPGGAIGALIASGIALGLSQLDSKFITWASSHNIPVPSAEGAHASHVRRPPNQSAIRDRPTSSFQKEKIWKVY
jgi:hypothetical protein